MRALYFALIVSFLCCCSASKHNEYEIVAEMEVTGVIQYDGRRIHLDHIKAHKIVFIDDVLLIHDATGVLMYQKSGIQEIAIIYK